MSHDPGSVTVGNGSASTPQNVAVDYCGQLIETLSTARGRLYAEQVTRSATPGCGQRASDIRARDFGNRQLAVPAAASAEAIVLAGERQRETVAALRRLPPRQRQAVVLRYFAELPEQETAAAMGVSLGTVKSTTSRALAALARMLQEEEP